MDRSFTAADHRAGLPRAIGERDLVDACSRGAEWSPRILVRSGESAGEVHGEHAGQHERFHDVADGGVGLPVVETSDDLVRGRLLGVEVDVDPPDPALRPRLERDRARLVRFVGSAVLELGGDRNRSARRVDRLLARRQQGLHGATRRYPVLLAPRPGVDRGRAAGLEAGRPRRDAVGDLDAASRGVPLLDRIEQIGLDQTAEDGGKLGVGCEVLRLGREPVEVVELRRGGAVRTPRHRRVDERTHAEAVPPESIVGARTREFRVVVQLAFHLDFEFSGLLLSSRGGRHVDHRLDGELPVHIGARHDLHVGLERRRQAFVFKACVDRHFDGLILGRDREPLCRSHRPRLAVIGGGDDRFGTKADDHEPTEQPHADARRLGLPPPESERHRRVGGRRECGVEPVVRSKRSLRGCRPTESLLEPRPLGHLQLDCSIERGGLGHSGIEVLRIERREYLLDQRFGLLIILLPDRHRVDRVGDGRRIVRVRGVPPARCHSEGEGEQDGAGTGRNSLHLRSLVQRSGEPERSDAKSSSSVDIEFERFHDGCRFLEQALEVGLRRDDGDRQNLGRLAGIVDEVQPHPEQP